MKTLAQQMLEITNKVDNRQQLDLIFNSLVLPKIKREAESKGNEVSFSTFNSNKEDAEVKKIFSKENSLQNLVGGLMKPYLEEKGFKVIICSPSYYTYIRW
jgi:hypothetical protein